MERRESITMTFSIPVSWVDWLNQETRRRRFANRSEMVREALRRMLEEEHERADRVAPARGR